MLAEVYLARNLYYIREGGVLSLSQIRKVIPANDDSGDDVKALMEFLKEENANCCFLYHKETTNGSTNSNTAPGAASLLLNEFHYGDSQGSKGHVDEVSVDLTMDESAAMESYAKDSRDDKVSQTSKICW